MGPWKDRLAESFRPPLRPPTQQQARRCFQKTSSGLRFLLSGWGDLNSRPSVPQTTRAQTPRHRLWPDGLIDHWFALVRDVSRPVRAVSAYPKTRLGFSGNATNSIAKAVTQFHFSRLPIMMKNPPSRCPESTILEFMRLLSKRLPRRSGSNNLMSLSNG